MSTFAAPASPTSGLAGYALEVEESVAARPRGKTASLYVSRRLTNGADLREWAAAQGFASVLDDLHVTIAFSRDQLAWDDVPESAVADLVIAAGADRDVIALGDKGAVVLRFESGALTQRWQEILNLGGSWGFDDYKPHLTITYQAGDVDLASLQPYAGKLVFGPERFAEVDDDWTSPVSETALKVAGPSGPTKDADTMSALKLFIPLTKVDAEKRLVYGTVAAETPDLAGEIMDYATAKPAFEKWSGDISKASDGKSLGNLRSMHSHVAAGKFTGISFDDPGKRIEAVAKVVDDAEWNKVLEGVYTGFSMGGKYAKRWKDAGNPLMTRYTPEPVEVSLVDSPCIPEATFSVVKADGTSELRKFKATAEMPELTNAEIAAKATELAKAAGDETKWQDHIEPARLALTKKVTETGTTAAMPATTEKPVAEHGATPADDGTEEQVWVHKRLEGKTFKTKSLMRTALAELDADEEARRLAGPALDALKGVTDELDKRDGGKKAETTKPAAEAPPAKKERTAAEKANMAKDGRALPDGSFAIDTAADLAGAIDGAAKTKNVATAKRHIVKRAKALKATDALPADWPGSTKDRPADKLAKLAGAELQKAASLYSVSNLIQILASLESAEESIEYPDQYYGVQVPKALRDRFGAIVVELGDITVELLDTLVSAMRAEEAGEAMAMAAPVVGLMKIGARHSRGDKALLKTAHDALVGLGHDCAPDASKADDPAELRKANLAEKTAFEKTVGSLAEEIKAIGERVKKIEATPIPAGPSAYRVVEKGAEGDRPATTGDVDAAAEAARQMVAKARSAPVTGFNPPA